jgi:3-keto-disaccharide hydrolase
LEEFMKRNVVLLVVLLIVAGLALAADSNQNTLTPKEKAAGWKLLFNGTNFDGWRGYRMTGIPESGWEIKDGLLKTVPKAKGRELITVEKFNDFELSWEWRVAPAGNNGVKYLVTEDRPGAPGPEYQMIDDEANADGKVGLHHATAAFYDVLPAPAERPLRKAGEWNESRILVQGNHVEHWLNGKKVLAFELGSEEVKAGLAKSKFAKYPDFGTKIQGHIMLTYHNDECWYRNIKIRPLPAK